VESLSTYARQFLGQMDKPDVDALEGLSPAVSIEQKTTSKNPRSTVGTVTEIYDYLRLLFARCSRPHCPHCGNEIVAQSVEDMVDILLDLEEGTKILLLAPLVVDKKGRHDQVLERVRKEGFVRVRIDGTIAEVAESPELEKNRRHTIEVVIDRIVIRKSIRRRLSDSVETAVKLAGGYLLVHFVDQGRDQLFSEHAACHTCSISLPPPSTQLFSFNNPQGACPECGGLGVKQFFDAALVVPDESKSIVEGRSLHGDGERTRPIPGRSWLQSPIIMAFPLRSLSASCQPKFKKSSCMVRAGKISASNTATNDEQRRMSAVSRGSFPSWTEGFSKPSRT